MANPLTQSIKPSGQGGDYTSLSSWESQNLDLVTLDSSSMALIQGDWSGSADVDRVVIDGWTTDATHGCIIQTDSANRAGTEWDGTKYIIQYVTNNPWPTIQLLENYFTFDGLQIEIDQTGTSWAICFHTITSGCVGLEISNCYAKDSSTGGSSSANAGFYLRPSQTMRLSNIVVDGFTETATSHGGIFGFGAIIIAHNVTVVNCGNGFRRGSSPDITVKNCLAQNCTDGFSGTFSTSSAYNISDIASDAPGSGSFEGTVTFESATDYALSPYDTTAIGRGISLYTASYAVTTDINGTSRGNESASYFDIGAFHSTQSIKTIKPSGQSGSYTSLSSWESGEQVNLVSVNKSAYAEITGNWSGSADTSICQINGWTTNETCSITVECIGTGSRHSGIWDNTKYVLDYAGTGNIVTFRVEVNYVIVNGLQIQTRQNGSGWVIGANVMYDFDPIGCHFKNCISKLHPSSNAGSFSGAYWNGSDYLVTYENCIAIDYSLPASSRGMGGFVVDPSSISRFYNCLALNCDEGFLTVGSEATPINCIAQNCRTGFQGTFSTASRNNISDDTTAPGSNSYTSSIVSFRNSASYDLRLANDDTIAIWHGYDLFNNGVITNFTDIVGVERVPRKSVTLDTSTLTSPLTNFPMLVNLNADSDIGGIASEDGNELWFSDSIGNVLSHDIEEFSIVSGSASGIIWVQLPTVPVAETYTLYMNCSPNEISQDAPTVWQDYKYVIRISGSIGDTPIITDMTGNYVWSASASPVVTSSAGLIGKGVNTSGGFIRTTSSSAPALLNSVGDCTFSSWMRPISTTGNNPYFDAQNGEGFIWTVGSTGYSEVDGTHWKTSGNSYDALNRSNNTMFVNSTSIWATHVHNSSSLEMQWFRNDVVWGVQTLLQGLTGTGATGQHSLGCFAHGGNRFTGIMNQMRFRWSSLSAEWVTLEYNNMSGNNTTFGDFETWDIGPFAYVQYDESLPQLVIFTNPNAHTGIFMFS